MRRSSLLLITGFALGFGLGFLVWQKQIGSRREENARLRDQVKDAEALRAENAKLTSERVDPAELNRLRDGQTELLRLRGQVSQLRQRLTETQAATNRTVTAKQPSPADETTQSPVETYTAKATMKIGWQQTMVTGGWKLPSGNRGLVLLQPLADETNPNAVHVRAQILELPESLMTGLGNLDASGKDSRGYDVLTTAEARALLDKIKNTEGASIMASPSVITASGQQAQVAVVDTFTGPNGENYSVGPVVDITPTIAPGNQLVELAVEARLNLRKGPR